MDDSVCVSVIFPDGRIWINKLLQMETPEYVNKKL